MTGSGAGPGGGTASPEHDELLRTVIEPTAREGDAAPGDKQSREIALRPGDEVGRYRLVRRLGAGGMGVVWVARDPELQRTVAIKLLHEQKRPRDATQARERLRREALALARLSHPNVVSIYDVGIHERRVFLAMEHVEGRTLDRWAEQVKPGLNAILRVFEAAAAGLAAVHQAGFVHRDFKPANVMLADDGRVLVMDFGLARVHDPEGVSEHGESSSSSYWNLDGSQLFSTVLTGDGVIMGTPAYMAPEQHTGAGADARADQFSLCVTLFEICMGRRPYQGRSVKELARNKHRAQIDFVEGRLRLPRRLRSVLRRGLHPEPARRFPEMAALGRQLALLRRPRSRRRLRLAAGALLLMGGAAWAGLRGSSVAVCEGGEERMSQVWDDTTRARLREAFATTELSYADDLGRRTIEGLDAYAEAWTEVHRRVCTAGAPVEGEVGALDRRMECLARAQLSLSATLKLLVEADATTVQHAVDQVAGLPPVIRCEGLEALPTEIAPPEDPAVLAEVAEVRARIDEAHALERAGHYAESEEKIRVALSEALVVGYEPLVIQARIRAASIQLSLGNPERAREGLVEAALAASGIGDHIAAADAATRLVYVASEENARLDEALRWARHAEASLDRAPPDRLARARLDGNLGVVYSMQGHYKRALEYYQRSYEVRRELLGDGDPEVAGALENMGMSYGELGELEQAEAYQRRAVASTESALGPRHPDYAHSLMNLGYTLDLRGLHDEAMALHTRALGILKAAVGTEHPMVARALGALGGVALSQDRLPEAEAYYRQASQMIDATLGDRHPEYAWSLVNLADVASQLGDDEQALELYERAQAALEPLYGPENDALAYVLVSASTSMIKLGRLESAREALDRARAIFEARLPPGHPAYAHYHGSRGDLLQAQGELKAARREHLRGLAVAEQALSSTHPDTANLLLSLGSVEHELGEHEDAREHLRRALAITEAGPVSEAFRAAIRFALAKTLWEAPALRAEAISLARHAHEGFVAYGEIFDEDVADIDAWLRARR